MDKAGFGRAKRVAPVEKEQYVPQIEKLTEYAYGLSNSVDCHSVKDEALKTQVKQDKELHDIQVKEDNAVKDASGQNDRGDSMKKACFSINKTTVSDATLHGLVASAARPTIRAAKPYGDADNTITSVRTAAPCNAFPSTTTHGWNARICLPPITGLADITKKLLNCEQVCWREEGGLLILKLL